MRVAILRSGILLAMVAFGASAATAQTELFFATGVDSTGWALAQSNADGHVLIESPQYPRGLWLHLVDEAGDALAGLQVEYQGRPDGLVAIRCVDPAGRIQETLVWTRPEGDSLRLMLNPREAANLPAGFTPIDWRIDPTAESLLEPVEEARMDGWEEVAAFLWAHWPGKTGRVAVQIKSSTTFTTLAVESDHPETIETLVAHLQQLHQPIGASLEEIAAIEIEVQVLKGNLALLEGMIHLNPFFFEDAALVTAVRKALGQAQSSPITRQEAASLIELWARDSGIHSLVGLGQLAALQRLYLAGNQIADVNPLTQLSLKDLELSNNQIDDVSPLSQLKNLQVLWLGSNQIADVNPLAQLKLRSLSLRDNQITDVNPLAYLKNLEELYLFNNQIEDVTSLAHLKNLQILFLYNNQVEDVNPLASLKNLRELSLSNNQIVDLNPLAQLENLRELSLSNNQIVDLNPLAHLRRLIVLSLRNNQIVDVNPLAQLKNLQELWLGGNQIADVSPVAFLGNLRRLYLENNQIEDISPLISNTGLGEGDQVTLQNNPLSDQALNEQIPALQARGVKVHF